MNTLHAGLMCTVLLTGTIAGLFGCMSAVRCHRRFAFAVCLAIASLDFAAAGGIAFPPAGKRDPFSRFHGRQPHCP